MAGNLQRTQHGQLRRGGQRPWWEPPTTPGRWAVGFAAGSVVLFALFNLFVMSGERGGDEFFSNLVLAIPILAAGVSAIAGGLMGAYAIAFRHERHPLVFASAILGVFVAIFILGEIGGHD